MSLPTETRREQIAEYILETGKASIAQLSLRFAVSDMTIRRDLTALTQQGRLKRTHGGAVDGFTPSEVNQSFPAKKTKTQPNVVVLNPMDQRTARLIVQNYTQLGIPVIAESIPFPGIASLIAIDSFQAGRLLGQWIGGYIADRGDTSAQVMFVGMPSFSDTAERARGFFEGLSATSPFPVETININGQGLRKESCQVALAVVSTRPHIQIMVGVNDQSTLGILDAVRELKLPLDQILLGTFGLEGSAGKDEFMQACPHFVGVAMFPELIGQACIDAAVLAHNRKPLHEQIVMPVRVVTTETLSDYYQRTAHGWEIKDEVIERLQAEEKSSLNLPRTGLKYPARVDFVRYLQDEYYEQLTAGMVHYGKQLGIEVVVNDASDDLATSIDLARHAIARAAAALINPGESVIIDSGTSNLYLAQELAEKAAKPLTVISHSLPVLELLSSAANIALIGVGGAFHRETQCFLGPQAKAAFDGLHADKAFLGVSGVSLTYGITVSNIAETEIKRQILKAAKEAIVLADSNKIGEVTLAQVAPISAFQKLVCDDQMTSQDRVVFTQAGIEIVLADNRS